MFTINRICFPIFRQPWEVLSGRDHLADTLKWFYQRKSRRRSFDFNYPEPCGYLIYNCRPKRANGEGCPGMIIYFYAPNLDCFGALSCFFFHSLGVSQGGACFHFTLACPRASSSLREWCASFSLWREHKTAHRNFHAYQIKKGTQWTRANSIFYFIEIGTCHRREETQAGNCRLFFTASRRDERSTSQHAVSAVSRVKFAPVQTHESSDEFHNGWRTISATWIPEPLRTRVCGKVSPAHKNFSLCAAAATALGKSRGLRIFS